MDRLIRLKFRHQFNNLPQGDASAIFETTAVKRYRNRTTICTVTVQNVARQREFIQIEKYSFSTMPGEKMFNFFQL